MNWMTRWPGDYAVFVDRAEGARFWDVDGNEFIDFCLGDTGGMAGHAPKASVDAIAEQAAKGITLMLPTRGRRVGRPRDGAAVRRAVLAVHADGDRRQPLRDPVGPPGDRPHEGRRAQLVLPRVGRRDLRDARRPRRRGGPGRATSASPCRSARDHAGRGDQRPRRRSSARSPTATSPRACSSRRSRTSASCCPTPATTRASAGCARSTARCW